MYGQSIPQRTSVRPTVRLSTAADMRASSSAPLSPETEFSSFKILKILQDSLSHQFFGRMHGVLNVGKKITNCTVCL
jgi:hypothetical protein